MTELMSPRLAYRTCGFVGFGLALLLALTLATYLGLSHAIVAGLAVLAVATFLSLALAAKMITGEERIVSYRQQVAVLVVSALFLRLMEQPVLRYLDLTILGVGVFLAFGRLGCFRVGCCHGRPAGWGISYSTGHVAAGFPGALAGVRLVPVQAMESLWLVATVAGGIVLVARGAAPGESLTWYVVLYGAGRFCLEFLRGDAGRLSPFGFSEAQWTSLIILGTVVLTEALGTLVLHGWHVAVFAGMALVMVVIATARKSTKGDHLLLTPSHVREMNQLLDTLFFSVTTPPVDVRVETTSLGLQISAGTVAVDEGSLPFYTLSRQDGVMGEGEARILAGLIRLLKHPQGRMQILKGEGGTFHLLVHGKEANRGSFSGKARDSMPAPMPISCRQRFRF